MAFKAKNKNKININSKQTIDAKHQDIIDDFKNKMNLIPDLEQEIIDINTQIDNLRKESDKNMIIDLTLETKIWDLEDKRNRLTEEISNVKNNINENKYMLKTSKILSEYYKVQENEKNNNMSSYSDNYNYSSSNGKEDSNGLV